MKNERQNVIKHTMLIIQSLIPSFVRIFGNRPVPRHNLNKSYSEFIINFFRSITRQKRLVKSENLHIN